MKNLRTRAASVAAAGLIAVAPIVAFAPSAAAIGSVDGSDPSIEIAVEDGEVAIMTLTGDIDLDESVVGEDGELDRSHLARTPMVDEDGDGYEDIMPLTGGTPIVDEDGDGYEDIVPLTGGTPIVDEDGDGYEDIMPLGEVGIEPISAEIVEDEGSNTGWIVAGAAAAVVAGGAGVIALRRRNA